MSKRRDRSAELDELRKAFANMAMFDVRPSARNKQHWDIFTRGGLWVGTVNRAGGSLLMRTLSVLTDQARTRTLRELPYPAKAQTRRGVRRQQAPPPTPVPRPTHSTNASFCGCGTPCTARRGKPVVLRDHHPRTAK